MVNRVEEGEASFWTLVLLDVIQELIYICEHVLPEIVPAPLGMVTRNPEKDKMANWTAAMKRSVDQLASGVQ